MARPEVIIIQLYRSSPSDLDIKDVPYPLPSGIRADDPIPGSGDYSLEQVVSERLFNFWRDTSHAREKPTMARAVGEDGRVLVEYHMTPSGPVKSTVTG